MVCVDFGVFRSNLSVWVLWVVLFGFGFGVIFLASSGFSEFGELCGLVLDLVVCL